MKMTVLCDKDTAVGLRLAGIKETYTPNGDAVKIFNEISKIIF